MFYYIWEEIKNRKRYYVNISLYTVSKECMHLKKGATTIKMCICMVFAYMNKNYKFRTKKHFITLAAIQADNWWGMEYIRLQITLCGRFRHKCSNWSTRSGVFEDGRRLLPNISQTCCIGVRYIERVSHGSRLYPCRHFCESSTVCGRAMPFW